MLPPFITLLDISKEIQSAILLKMNRYYWVRAEIAKLNYYRQSGHCYPQLVEKKDNQVIAELRATIWANDYQTINRKFQAATGEVLSEGMTILCYARVNFHPVYGLSLQIADIDPTFSLGEMARERQATIKKLQEAGLWDRNRKLNLPLLPKRLAIISVETSKGYQDFRSIIDNNPWGYGFVHFLFPALLQGDKAVESIGKQLDVISLMHRHFDAVLIIRGGGGDVGLNCFDHYNLASRVAAFPIPVISGIGHSTNETIVEMISHTNSITPTDLAYGLIQYFHDFAVMVDQLSKSVTQSVNEILDQEAKRVSETSSRMVAGTLSFTRQRLSVLRQMAARATYGPLQTMAGLKGSLVQTSEWIPRGAAKVLASKRNQIDGLARHLHLLDPKNVLERGYSIARHHGKALRDASDVALGDTIEITLYQGIIESKIDKIRKK